jgi:hypothetical protein
MKKLKDLLIRMKKLSSTERYTESILRETRQLEKYLKLVPTIDVDPFHVNVTGPDRALNQMAAEVRSANRSMPNYSNQVKLKAKSPQSLLNQVKGTLRGMKGFVMGVPGVATAVMVVSTAVGAVLRAVNFLRVAATQMLTSTARQLQSFFTQGISQAALAQMELISQVNTLATLQGLSYNAAMDQTIKNNKEFMKVVAGLPGNTGTYTTLYQQGIDEQLSIFGTTEKALENVKVRGKDSFTVLLGKKAAESGMPAEMVVRDLAQLRNDPNMRGIGIVYSDRVLMKKFEEYRSKSLAELLDVLKLDSKSAKGAAEFSEGDKRVLALYAALYESQSPQKDEATANSYSSLTQRMQSLFMDTTVGLWGFARVLSDDKSVVDKATEAVKAFWSGIMTPFTAIVGSSFDPMELLGKSIVELRYQIIQLNYKLLDTFNIQQFSEFKLPQNITELTNGIAEYVAAGINAFSNIINKIFNQSKSYMDQPDSVLRRFTDAFFLNLDPKAISGAGNAIGGLIEKLAHLIKSAGIYFWPILTDVTVSAIENKGVIRVTKPVVAGAKMASGDMSAFGQSIMPTTGIPVTPNPVVIPDSSMPLEKLKAMVDAPDAAGGALAKSGLFRDLKTTKDVFDDYQYASKYEYRGRLNTFQRLRGVLAQLALSGSRQTAYLNVGGQLPPAPDRATALGQALTLRFGQYMKSKGYYLHQHPVFDAERGNRYRFRGTGSYHDRGRAIDVLLPGGAATMYNDQIPILRDTVSWAQSTGNPPTELFHGADQWTGPGKLDTPAHNIVGGIHHHHVHVAFSSGNLAPLTDLLKRPEPTFTVEVIEMSPEELRDQFLTQVETQLLESQAIRI